MSIVYVSLGSNLGNREANLQKAINSITQRIGIVQQKSSIYETEPWGFNSFNNFLNLVIEIRTELNAEKVLVKLLEIEQDMGRKRDHEGYQDRIIDLDILLFDDIILKNKELEIPHPRLHQRLFTLEPLAEIAPDIFHPRFKTSIKTLLTTLLEEQNSSI